MKTIRMLGCAGIASFALALTANSPSFAEGQTDPAVAGEKSGSLVHRVSHTLAASERYSGNVPSGYKWGQQESRDAAWGNTGTQGGYKWGDYKETALGSSSEEPATSDYSEQTRNPWGRRDYAEQSRNPWGRRDFSEQSRNPWGRRDFSEQSRNPWGRRDFSEQSRNPWGRRDFSVQSRNPWGRRDFSEQSRNPWGRRDYSEQARNPWGRR